MHKSCSAITHFPRLEYVLILRIIGKKVNGHCLPPSSPSLGESAVSIEFWLQGQYYLVWHITIFSCFPYFWFSTPFSCQMSNDVAMFIHVLSAWGVHPAQYMLNQRDSIEIIFIPRCSPAMATSSASSTKQSTASEMRTNDAHFSILNHVDPTAHDTNTREIIPSVI